MSLFTLDISPLLSAPVGTSEEFRFEREIPEDMWDDLVCEGDLKLTIKLIRMEYGIECIIIHGEGRVTIPSEGIQKKSIELENIGREFHLKKIPTDSDDIGYIDDRRGTIDLDRVIEEELLIAGL